jgi:hypothetical protein
MMQLTQIFVTATLLAGMLALISIWSRRRLLVKLGALGTALLLIPVTYAAFATLLSRPKPVDLEWGFATAAEATVLGSRAAEEQGIYLWLQLPESQEPRAYVMPWDRKTAEQLQQALREAEQNQSGVKMRLPFEPGLDDREPKFYAMPQPAMPPKDLTDPPPQYYQAPGSDA